MKLQKTTVLGIALALAGLAAYSETVRRDKEIEIKQSNYQFKNETAYKSVLSEQRSGTLK